MNPRFPDPDFGGVCKICPNTASKWIASWSAVTQTQSLRRAGASFALTDAPLPTSAVSINQFVRALLLIELLLFFLSECGLSEPDHHLIELAGELERHMVVFADGCPSIFTNVEGLVRRNAERNSSRQLLSTFFPSTLNVASPPLPIPPPSYLK
jgi:hypothetical protein